MKSNICAFVSHITVDLGRCKGTVRSIFTVDLSCSKGKVRGIFTVDLSHSKGKVRGIFRLPVALKSCINDNHCYCQHLGRCMFLSIGIFRNDLGQF